jgi:hypothetical protein
MYTGEDVVHFSSAEVLDYGLIPDMGLFYK